MSNSCETVAHVCSFFDIKIIKFVLFPPKMINFSSLSRTIELDKELSLPLSLPQLDCQNDYCTGKLNLKSYSDLKTLPRQTKLNIYQSGYLQTNMNKKNDIK